MLRVNVRCSYTLEVEEDEVRGARRQITFLSFFLFPIFLFPSSSSLLLLLLLLLLLPAALADFCFFLSPTTTSSVQVHDSDMDFSSDEESQFDTHFTHLQLCDEEDFCNSTVRNAEQALLTIHSNSFLDSENEELGMGDNLLSWSGICNNEEGVLNRVESDVESVTTEVGSVDCEEDCEEDGLEEPVDYDVERRFQLAALPLRSQLESEPDPDGGESTSASRSFYAQDEFEEELPNVPYRRVLRHSRLRRESLQAIEGLQSQIENQVRLVESPELPVRQSPIISNLLPYHIQEQDHSGEHSMPGTPIPIETSYNHEEEEEEEDPSVAVEEEEETTSTSGVGFLNPFELACEVVRSMKEEETADASSKKEPGEEPCYNHSSAEDTGMNPLGTYPFSKKAKKPKERVKFVWQPYESFSQYNFHTMYSMKKRKSRSENPLPAVGSALTGLVHMYQNKELSRLPPCYLASKFPPVEYIKRRESKEVESELKRIEVKNSDKGKHILLQDRQKKSKVTLRRERAKSPLHASMLVAKHSSKAIVNSAKSSDEGKSTLVNHRRPSRVHGKPDLAQHQPATLSKIDLKKTSDQPSTSSNKTRYDANSYLNNSSLLNDSAMIGGRKGVVRGLTFRRASGKFF